LMPPATPADRNPAGRDPGRRWMLHGRSGRGLDGDAPAPACAGACATFVERVVRIACWSQRRNSGRSDAICGDFSPAATGAGRWRSSDGRRSASCVSTQSV
jgi:hypothetical protein